MRGGTTAGPVGDLRKRFSPSLLSSVGNRSSLQAVPFGGGPGRGPLYEFMVEDVAATPARRRDQEVNLISGGGALGRSRLGGGLAHVGRGRVPTAGGGGHVDGVFGLRLHAEGLDREPGRCQRLGVEPLGDIVALAAGVGIALRGREAEPFEG